MSYIINMSSLPIIDVEKYCQDKMVMNEEKGVIKILPLNSYYVGEGITRRAITRSIVTVIIDEDDNYKKIKLNMVLHVYKTIANIHIIKYNKIEMSDTISNIKLITDHVSKDYRNALICEYISDFLNSRSLTNDVTIVDINSKFMPGTAGMIWSLQRRGIMGKVVNVKFDYEVNINAVFYDLINSIDLSKIKKIVDSNPMSDSLWKYKLGYLGFVDSAKGCLDITDMDRSNKNKKDIGTIFQDLISEKLKLKTYYYKIVNVIRVIVDLAKLIGFKEFISIIINKVIKDITNLIKNATDSREHNKSN